MIATNCRQSQHHKTPNPGHITQHTHSHGDERDPAGEPRGFSADGRGQEPPAVRAPNGDKAQRIHQHPRETGHLEKRNKEEQGPKGMPKM